MTTMSWQPNYNVKVTGKLKKRLKKKHKHAAKALRKASMSDYQQSLLPANLPDTTAHWLHTAPHSVRIKDASGSDKPRHEKNHTPAEHLSQLIRDQRWRWPDKPVVYITDPHADPEALFYSLISSGGVERTGPKLEDFRLTSFGKTAHFVIGGDCFDKGPSTLGLLDFIQLFIKKGAKLTVLAGNHDLRVLFGMQQVGQHCARNSHFFIRMGVKCIPLIQELIVRHQLDKHLPADTPDVEACRRALMPADNWYERFPVDAQWIMPDSKIEKEIEKVNKKIKDFFKHCNALDLDLRQVYAAAKIFQQEFLSKNGSYYWFYKSLRLALHEGSFLFLHAGVDDRFCTQLQNLGVKSLNKRFRQEMELGSPFDIYYGWLLNTVRTKYRSTDLAFTREGADKLRQSGVQAIVQGHINRYEGQSITIRTDIIHIECDITLDRHSRRKEGLSGIGAGCTLVLPSEKIVGVSNDWEHVKLLDMAAGAVH